MLMLIVDRVGGWVVIGLILLRRRVSVVGAGDDAAGLVVLWLVVDGGLMVVNILGLMSSDIVTHLSIVITFIIIFLSTPIPTYPTITPLFITLSIAFPSITPTIIPITRHPPHHPLGLR